MYENPLETSLLGIVLKPTKGRTYKESFGTWDKNNDFGIKFGIETGNNLENQDCSNNAENYQMG